MKRLLRFALSLATLALLPLLGFSLLAPWMPLADSVSHFRLHLLLALGGLIVPLALLNAPRLASISLAAGLGVALTLQPVLVNPIGTSSAQSPSAQGTSVRLLQFNMLFRNPSLTEAVAMIRRENPDVITLQEVSKRNRAVIDALSEQYPHRIFCPFATVGGVAVLSRLPQGSGAAAGCATGAAWLTARIGDRDITLASLHLSWPYPFRQKQHIDRLVSHFRSWQKPILLAGDFNAAAWSHAVARVRAATQTRVLGGLRFTYHRKLTRWGPWLGLPIDHVLIPGEVEAATGRLAPAAGSDHRPVVADLRFH